jgi:hypothetical protein
MERFERHREPIAIVLDGNVRHLTRNRHPVVIADSDIPPTNNLDTVDSYIPQVAAVKECRDWPRPQRTEFPRRFIPAIPEFELGHDGLRGGRRGLAMATLGFWLQRCHGSRSSS